MAGIVDFSVDFSPLARLPQIREQAQAQEALKGLGSLSLNSPEDLASAAQKAFASGNAQVGIQLLSAANQQRAAQQRAANMDINTALLYGLVGGAAQGVPPVVVPGGGSGSSTDQFTYTPAPASEQAVPSATPTVPPSASPALPPWTPTPIPSLPFPSGSPGTLGEASPPVGLGSQFAGPGAQTAEPQLSISEPLVAPMQFPSIGGFSPSSPSPPPSVQSPPGVAPSSPSASPSVQSPSGVEPTSGVITQGQAGQSELQRIGRVTTQSGATLRPRDVANLMPLYRQQQNRVIGEGEKLALYNYDQRQRELQGLARQPRQVWDAAQELQKKELDQYVKTTENYYEDARKGQDVRQTLSALQAMVSNGAITGYGRAITTAAGSLTNWVRSTAIQQGLDPKLVDKYIPKTLENFERTAGVDAAVQALHNGLVLAQAGSLSRGFSEGDRVFVDLQHAGLHMTGPALAATVKYQEAIWQRREEYARIATQYTKFELDRGRVPTRGGLQDAIAKFNDQNPLFQYKDKNGKYVKTALGQEISDGLAKGAGGPESGSKVGELPDLLSKGLGEVRRTLWNTFKKSGKDALLEMIPEGSSLWSDPFVGALRSRSQALEETRRRLEEARRRRGQTGGAF